MTNLAREVRKIASIGENVKITVDEIGDLNHVGFAAPSELFLTKIVGGKLLKTVEWHEFFVNIADQMHNSVVLLQLSEDFEDGFIGILIGDFAKHTDRIRTLQCAKFPNNVGLFRLEVLLQEIILYLCEHTILSF